MCTVQAAMSLLATNCACLELQLEFFCLPCLLQDHLIQQRVLLRMHLHLYIACGCLLIAYLEVHEYQKLYTPVYITYLKMGSMWKLVCKTSRKLGGKVPAKLHFK